MSVKQEIIKKDCKIINKIGFDGMQLRYIAMLCMLIDHIGVALIGSFIGEESLIYYFIMRTIGRLAFPLFCFLAAEGVKHTKNIKKYVISMWVFALISEIPFNLAESGLLIYTQHQNIYFTLALGITAYWICKEINYSLIRGIVLITVPFVAKLINADYDIQGILALYVCFYGGLWYKSIAGSVIILSNMLNLYGLCFYFYFFGLLVSLIYIFLICFYNGKRGCVHGNKYWYYAFYPVHLLILGIIRVFF